MTICWQDENGKLCMATEDAGLERRINAARLKYVDAITKHTRQQAWDELVSLIRQRSPKQVDSMEREKGLR